MHRSRPHRRLLPCLALLLPLAAAAQHDPGSPRAHLDLPSWRFQPGHLGTPPVAAEWVEVPLPYNWTETWKRPAAAAQHSWAKQDLQDVNSGWYETEVIVPTAWQGRRLVLQVRRLQCDAVISVNGREVGEIRGPEGRLELGTARRLTVPPTGATAGTAGGGETLRLRLWVTRWWEGVKNQRAADLFRDLTIQGMPKTRWYDSPEQARRAIPGGLGGATLLALPPTAELEGAAVATSLRRHELGVRVDYRLYAPAAGAHLQARVTELDGTAAALPALTAPLQSGEVGVPRRQTLTLPWASPHLWEVGAGYLYLLDLRLLDADGRVLDVYPPVRFGFREIRAEGRELLLNDHPLRLRTATFVAGVPQMLFYEGMGFDTIAFQPNPTGWYGPWGLFPGGGLQAGTEALLDAADERGWAVLMPVPGVSITRDAILGEQGRALYERDLRLWLGELDRRNRPSILMWCPSMNTQGLSGPAQVGRLPSAPQPPWFAKVEEYIRMEDPTRLIYHHQGGQTGDVQTSNLYLNWVPLAEQEEYLSAWSRQGERPWGAIEHGAPLSVDFIKRGGVPLLTEYCAIYLGDAAYAAETDRYVAAALRAQQPPAVKDAFEAVGRLNKDPQAAAFGEDTAYFAVTAPIVARVSRAWRTYGLNGGAFPWFFDVGFGRTPGYKPGSMGYLYEGLEGTAEELHRRPAWANPLYDAYRETMQPLLVYLGGPVESFTARASRYAAGETAERSLLAVWDGPGVRELSARWQLTAAGKQLASGTEQLRLRPGDIVKRPLRFTVPREVKTRTAAVLALQVRERDGRIVANDRQELTFLPPAMPLPALRSRWGLYDPAGQAGEWVHAGLRVRPVRAGDSLAGLDVLVLGPEAVDTAPRLPFTEQDVRAGLRVLVLEQGLAGLEALGLRAQDSLPRQVFLRAPGHPALAGVTPGDLTDWRGSGGLLPPTSAGMRVWPWVHGPHCGNTGAVASVVLETPHKGAFTPLLESDFDLAYSPLLQWRHGRGQVLLSQLDLLGRLGKEPAADRIARNLLAALDRPDGRTQARQITLVGSDAATAGLLTDLGLQWRRADAAALPAGPESLLAVAPGGAGACAPGQLARCVAAGGTVVFLASAADDLRAAALPWPLPLEPRTAARVPPAALTADPLLTGVGPELLHWRTPLAGNLFRSAGLPAGSQRLLDGWLLRVPAGKGFWVFCQVDWRQLQDGSENLRRTRWNARKLYRQLFTNLGAATDEALARQMLGAASFAPMATVNTWQVLQQVAAVSPEVTAGNAVPGLSAPLEAERWLQGAAPGQAGPYRWRLAAADANGYVDFTPVASVRPGQVAYAVTQVFSSVAREAVAALSADYWLVLRVNGKTLVDQGREGRANQAPGPGELQLRLPLRAGWNRLEVKVASGSRGFGFWCQVSDPGDLRLSPTLTAPARLPTRVAARDALRREPVVVGAQPLYTEPLQKEDDPYGFTAW